MSEVSIVERFRIWLAGCLFALAGRVHESYDVWLDDAPRKNETEEIPSDSYCGCGTRWVVKDNWRYCKNGHCERENTVWR